MQARPLVLLALSVGALGAFGDTSPVTTSYRIDITRDQTLQLSALGQPDRQQHQSTAAFVTIALTDSAGGKSVGFLIDSLHVDTTLGIPQPIVDSTRGASATTFLAAGGRPATVTTVKDGPLAGGIFPLLHHLYPRVKPGAKVGSSWTDTLDFTSSPGTASVSVRMVANWAVMADESKDGQATRKVQEAYSLAQTGQITSPQGTLTLSGTGTGTATYWIGTDGHLVAQQMAESLSSTLSSPDLPAPLPVLSKTTVTTAALK
jgi:hypothetical protein